MPFWSKKEKKTASMDSSNGNGSSNGSNGSNEENSWVKDPKVNYKAKLEHKQYLVSQGI
jgi:hypothetical protein